MKNKKRKAQDGFTLLEILVAFIILALATGTIMSMFGSSFMRVATSENERLAALSARSLLARVGSDVPLEPAVRNGEMPGRIRWSVTIQPYDQPSAGNDSDTPPPVTTPYRVTVRAMVGPQSHPSVAELTTLRLKTGALP
jgi:general secretion pathway protein I